MAETTWREGAWRSRTCSRPGEGPQTVRTVHGSISTDERQQAAEALHDSIAGQVEAFTELGEWERFLAFAGAFHACSLSNMLLILSQCLTATRVAGFRKWQTVGWQVRRGMKGIRIFGYRTIKTDDLAPSGAGGEGQDEAGERVRVRAVYPLLSVFDIVRTDLTDPDAGDSAARVRSAVHTLAEALPLSPCPWPSKRLRG